MDIEIPGYQLLRTIGKGGMATVFLAKQQVLERKVALKIMSKALAEESAFGERFMREARIVSQLVHPNIVTVHEVGQHEGRYFLSMEYIDGHDLRTVGKRLDILGKIRVIEDIARALHYAGEKGYVHRDIKPENIMFRSADGSAVLTDFGIAKAVKTDLSMTQTGTAIGTPHYMSPEQAKGKPVDHRSDLYSLGVVFYQLLTGKVPFDAETAIAIGIKHITEPVPTLPEQYSLLQPILDGLMSKNVENRYQSGLSLLNDLRRINFDELKDVESVDHDNESQGDALTVLSGAEFTEEDNHDTDRFTIEFNAVDTVERTPAAIWPAAIASLFVVSVVVLFIYLARPAVLEPLILEVERVIHKGRVRVVNAVESGQSYAEETAKTLLPEDTESNQELEGRKEAVDSSEPVFEPASNNLTVDSTLSGTDKEDESTEISQEAEVLEAAAETVDTTTPIEAPELPSLDELNTERKLLELKYKTDSAVLAELVAKLYEIRDLYPDTGGAEQLLELLAKTKEEALIQHAEKGRRTLVDELLLQYRNVFTNEPANRREARERETSRILRRVSLMEKARQQLLDKQVSIPVENNAVDTLYQVLAIEPSHEEALSLLDEVSSAYLQEANKAHASGDLAKARVALDRALKASPTREDALELDAKLKEEKSRQDKIVRHLAQAAVYSEHGFLYAPDGANAYDEYQAVLSLEKQNTQANAGVSELLDKLSVLVWKYVGEARFTEASELLARPMVLMPGNERLLAMNAAIEEVAP